MIRAASLALVLTTAAVLLAGCFGSRDSYLLENCKRGDPEGRSVARV